MHPVGEMVSGPCTERDKDSIPHVAPSCFFGPDCSLRMCAKGDDPLSLNQVQEKLLWRLAR